MFWLVWITAGSSRAAPCGDKDMVNLSTRLIYWLEQQRNILDAQMDSVPHLRVQRHITDVLRKHCEYLACLKDQVSADVLQSAEALFIHLRKQILQGGVAPEALCTCSLPLAQPSTTPLWNLQQQMSAVLHSWILELQNLTACS